MRRTGIPTFPLCCLLALTLLPISAATADSTVFAWGDNTYGQCTIPTELTNATTIAGGNSHSLALKSDRTVMAWGENSFHQTDVPPNLADVVAVAAGYNHNLALKADGAVVAWGQNSSGQTNVPLGLANVVAIAAGQVHSLVLKNDGTVVAWGNNSFGQANVPAGLTNVVAISAGYVHSLALKADGSVVAWGNQTNAPSGLTNVMAIAAGQNFSLALKSDGTVVAWGSNSSGQTNVPPNLTGVAAITAGAAHSLALKTDGTIVAWGRNTSGQTNVPLDLSHVLAVAGGGSHSLVLGFGVPPFFLIHPLSQTVLAGTNISFTTLAAGSAPLSYQWQLNGLAVSGATNSSLFVPSVQTSGSYSCLVTNAYGANTSHVAGLTVQSLRITGQPQSQSVVEGGMVSLSINVLGSPPLSYRWQFNGIDIADATKPNLVQIAAAGNYSCIIANSSGSITSQVATVAVTSGVHGVGLIAWGDNEAGQTDVPAGLTNVVAMAGGSYHSLALQANGIVVAWGENSSGQADVPAGMMNVVAVAAGDEHSLALRADGTVVQWGYSPRPDVVMSLANVVAIAAGFDHSLALHADGTVVEWGPDDYELPSNLTDVIAIAGGGFHSVALRADGTVVTWGLDGYNDDEEYSFLRPVPPGLTNVAGIAAGGDDFLDSDDTERGYSLALRANGTVVAWGDDYYGQTNVPVTLTNVVGVAGGTYHGLALRADGTVVAWGDNGSGQTNVPAGLTNVGAIAGGGFHSLALVGNKAPFITSPLADRLALIGSTIYIQASVSGSRPVSYRWQLNGTNLPTATNAILRLTNVQLAQSGSYSVTVSNALGSITSRSARVTVVPAIITAQPQSQTAALGGSVVFSVGFQFLVPVSYQWLFNGAVLPGATHPTLQLDNLTLAAAGRYSVLLSNAYGSVMSAEGVLALVPLLITAQPQNLGSQILGTSVGFSVAVQAFAPLNYQWLFNGIELPGATNATLQLNNLSFAAAGRYSVVVSNRYGRLISSEGALAVIVVAVWGNDYSPFGGATGQTNLPAALTNVVALAAGYYHSLALRADGTILAWGSDYNEYGQFTGQTIIPAGLTNVVAVAAGYFYSLALRQDGTVVAWGDNYEGQTTVPTGLTNVVAIAGGGFHSLALRADGTVVGWGRSHEGQTAVPSGLTNVTAIACGTYHSLAVRADGSVVAWGDGFYGATNVPVGLSNGVAVAAGEGHSLVLQADGTVVAWGYDFYGQTDVSAGLTDVVAISAGGFHSLALRGDGTTVEWGDNYSRPAGFPVGLTNVAAIADSRTHSLALIGIGRPFVTSPLTDRLVAIGGTVDLLASASGPRPLSYQWQFNGRELADATNAVLVLTNVQLVQAGSYSVTVSNQLGTATSRNARLSVVPAWFTAQSPSQIVQVLGSSVDLSVAVQSFVPVTYQWQFEGAELPAATNGTLHLESLSLAASGRYSVVVSNAYGAVTGGETALSVVVVAAWGNNDYGQTRVPADLSNVVAVAGGFYHSLALRPDGTVAAWGGNYDGQISVPAGLTSVVAIAAGAYHSLALRGDGTVVAWGANYYLDYRDYRTHYSGQTNVPTDLTNAVAIAAGETHSLALRMDGTVVAWGNDSYGQTQVPADLTNVVAIAGGAYHGLALRADGTVVAWGASGQTNVPVDLTNVVAIAAGGYHSLALRADGTVLGWGDDGYGEIDIPTGLTNVLAIAGGNAYSLAVRADGTMVAWGLGEWDVTIVPGNLGRVVGIAAGVLHGLALVGDGSPLLTVQPFSQRVPGGGSIVLNSMAAGQPPMSFQWQFNGTNLPGATNASLQLANVQLSQAGAYAVVISNTLGVVTSKAAQLRVLVPPSFDPLPAQSMTTAGSTVTFTIDATGTPPLRYQWRKNGVNLVGATNSTFTITNVQVPDGASYSVVVANDVGSAASDSTVLVVEVLSQAPPEDNFANRRTLAGTNGFASGTNRFATGEAGEPFHAGKFGSNSVWYKWTAPATGIATFRTVGSTFDTLLGIYTGTNVSALTFVASDEDRGGFLTSQARLNVEQNVEYEIAVDGFAGQQGSFILNWELEVTDDELPVITAGPVSQTVVRGSDATFLVVVRAHVGGYTYQWYFNFQRIPGANSAVLQVSNVQPDHVGLYTVAVTNSAGRGVESLPATLEIGSVAGVQSVGKIQDLLGPGGAGAHVLGPRGRAAAAAASGGSELLVGMGSIDSQIINNTSPANSGVPLPQTCSGIGGSARTLILTPTNSGTLVIDTLGSTIDTLLAVYTASGFSFSQVACDNNGAPDGIRSLVRFEAVAGTKYLVAADGVNGAQGIIQLNWAMGRAPDVHFAPTNQVVARGSAVVFSITVSNAIPPARCQWLLNNRALAGATNTTLLVTNVLPANAGVYSVFVINAIDSVLVQVASVALQPELAAVAESKFEQNGDAWNFSGDASWLYQATGGRFGGCLSALSQRAGGKWNWFAPGKFLGNQSATYGGFLQFGLKQSAAAGSSTNLPRVVLGGNGLTLSFQASLPAGTNWTSYEIPLQDGTVGDGPGWMRSDGRPAFGADLRQVLANLSAVQISGQFNTASESAGLDAVEFLAPCTDSPPPLLMHWQTNPLALILEWPANALCYQLEMAGSLSVPNWTTNLPLLTSSLTNNLNRTTLSLSQTNQFFRLRQR